MVLFAITYLERNQSVKILTKLNNKKPPEDKTTTAKNKEKRKEREKEQLTPCNPHQTTDTPYSKSPRKS